MVKFFLKPLLYSGYIITPISAVSVVILTALLLDLRNIYMAIVLSFIGGEIIYFLNRYKEKDKEILWRSKYIKEKSLCFLIILAILFFILSLFIYQNKPAFIFLYLIIILGILYTLYLKKLTKIIPGFKNVFVAFVWGMIVIFTFLFDIVFIKLVPTISIFLFVFLNVLIYEILLDLRDKKRDSLDKLITIPQLLKINTLRGLMVLLNIFIIVIIGISIYEGFLELSFSFLIFSVVYNFFIFEIFIKNEMKMKNQIEIFVDIGKILWPIEIILFNNLLR